MTKSERNTILETIAHWDRMIDWAKKREKRWMVSRGDMCYDVGENWRGEHCPLCVKYKADYVCGKCPLLEKYGRCGYGRKNLWLKVHLSETWGTWVKNAEKFREQIASLLEEAK